MRHISHINKLSNRSHAHTFKIAVCNDSTPFEKNPTTKACPLTVNGPLQHYPCTPCGTVLKYFSAFLKATPGVSCLFSSLVLVPDLSDLTIKETTSFRDDKEDIAHNADACERPLKGIMDTTISASATR